MNELPPNQPPPDTSDLYEGGDEVVPGDSLFENTADDDLSIFEITGDYNPDTEDGLVH